MRIAFIGGRGVGGVYSGIETYYEAVGCGLVRRGHEVTVYCRSYFTPRMERYLGMRVVRLRTVRSKHLETLAHSFVSTLHALTKHYDIVHYHSVASSLFVPLMRLAGVKTVVSVQGLEWRREKWGTLARAVLRLCERTAAWFPDATIVVSRSLQKHYERSYGGRSYYIPNAANVAAPRQAGEIRNLGLEAGKYILFVGRLSPEKNCHVLIEAFRAVQTEMRLVVAGDGPERDPYVCGLKAAGDDRIRFLGNVTGRILEELFSNAAIFVLPSTIEGQSLALLEAMSYGNCVVASDIPENLELVEGIGFTFETGNAADLALVLGGLLRAPGTRSESGRKARARVEANHQWAKVVRDTEQIYLRLNSGRSS